MLLRTSALLARSMRIVHIPCLQDNYSYLIIDESTKKAAAVDPVEPEKVLKVAKDNGADLKMVLTTHHHWDHAGGNEKMKCLLPEIEVYGGSIDNVKSCTKKVENGDKMSLGAQVNILSLHTPCHTNGHISYYVTGKEDEDPAVFSGDTLSPLSPENGRLVGFGRAVSDLGLTASIYDVMVGMTLDEVLPGLRRMGIGRMIVHRIVRMLTNKGVYDIAALCSDQESLFFKTCGFGDDLLGSTTMMYGAGASPSASTTTSQAADLYVKAGRRLLLGPPLRRTTF